MKFEVPIRSISDEKYFFKDAVSKVLKIKLISTYLNKYSKVELTILESGFTTSDKISYEV
jgi:hypothetical protein